MRAARISAAGHGGQILVSETTRALIGNQLPQGVQVHDLGKQNLKDIQHEHVYELSVDGASAGTKPLKTAALAQDSSSRDRIEALRRAATRAGVQRRSLSLRGRHSERAGRDPRHARVLLVVSAGVKVDFF